MGTVNCLNAPFFIQSIRKNSTVQFCLIVEINLFNFQEIFKKDLLCSTSFSQEENDIIFNLKTAEGDDNDLWLGLSQCQEGE